MKIIQKVVVKHVLTENSKHTLKEKFEKKRDQVYKEYQQLLFEYKKMEKKRGKVFSAEEQTFEREIKNRKEKLESISFQLEQLQILPLGYELKEGEIDAIVNIEVGDVWENVRSKTIVVRDGQIVDIR